MIPHKNKVSISSITKVKKNNHKNFFSWLLKLRDYLKVLSVNCKRVKKINYKETASNLTMKTSLEPY
jgi:hypothetical protein